jgi:hypothetical protein
MMTLLAFISIIGVITAIARYNESEKLFWSLLVSFVGAYAAVNVAVNLLNDKKEDKVVMIEKAPMQVLESVPLLTGVLADTSLSATMREKSPKPASKDMLFNLDNNILSEVHRKARGQPQWYMYFSDS